MADLGDRTSSAAQDRCDKCGTPKAQWATTPCVKSLTQSPRHTITRFHIPIPEAAQDRFESHHEALGYTLGTGKLFVPIDIFHEWAELLLGRPILTLEFAMHDTWDELREVFEEAAKVRVEEEADPSA